ncbi:MAG TPA: hypothetical protein VHZ25_07740 [Acidobacteriaceae bacterium]|jgi:hypothetical protein|nr:hypothetical protein [Acidobacteriaceae bacterium]
MQVRDAVRILPIDAVMAILFIVVVPAFVRGRAQAKPPAAGGANSIPLQNYTASDQSASAGVPAGWKVVAATGTAIEMTGPGGEVISLGEAFVAHDGTFHAGQKGPAGATMSMPYPAKLTDKLVMVLQQRAALNGNPAPQIKFLSAAALQMPPVLGQCGKFAIDMTGIAKPMKAMGIFCSQPEDSAQFFKNFYMLGAAPEATAPQAVSTVLAVFASYKIPPAWVQKKFAPFTPPPAASLATEQQDAAALNALLMRNNYAQMVSDQGATCEHYQLMDAPDWQTPRECGGKAPNP